MRIVDVLAASLIAPRLGGCMPTGYHPLAGAQLQATTDLPDGLEPFGREVVCTVAGESAPQGPVGGRGRSPGPGIVDLAEQRTPCSRRTIRTRLTTSSARTRSRNIRPPENGRLQVHDVQPAH